MSEASVKPKLKLCAPRCSPDWVVSIIACMPTTGEREGGEGAGAARVDGREQGGRVLGQNQLLIIR